MKLSKPQEVKLRRTAGCLTDCVAYYFNIFPANVPLFVRPNSDWMRELKAYFRRRGYTIKWLVTNRIPKTGKHIVCGKSLKSTKYSHAVMYKNGELSYDPNFQSQWKDKLITHRLLVRKVH
jgi:hypothetical protein